MARPRGLFFHLLGWFAALTVVPIFLLGLLLASRLADARAHLADQQLELATEALARDVDLVVENRVRALEVFAGNLELTRQPLDAERWAALLARFRAQSGGFTIIYAASPDGRSLVADPPSLEGEATAPRDYADRDYYRELMRTRRTVAMTVASGKATRAPTIAVAVPLLDAETGELWAYVCGSIDLASLQTAVRQIGAASTSIQLMVLDEHSRVLAHASRATMLDVSSVKLFSGQGEPLRRGPDERGVPSRAAIKPISVRGLGWVAGAYLDEAQLDREVSAVRLHAALTAAVTLVLSLLACLLFAARLARPIAAVARAARQVGKGDFHTALESHTNDPLEVTELVEAVTQMAAERQRLAAMAEDHAQKLTVANAQLEQNLAALRDAQVRGGLSDRLAAVGTLAAGVAHEINNPTAYVRANVTFVSEELAELKKALGAEHHPRLDELLVALAEASEGTQRVQGIVRDLKVFARDGQAEREAPFELHPLVESTLSMCWNDLRHKATLVRDLRPVPLVKGNRSKLAQVVLNLVVNAIQAFESPGAHNQVRVCTRQEGDRVLLDVEDNGSGIAPENLGRIFDPFFTTKPVGQGTGLGLAISREIVAAMGGTLEVSSTLGKGTCFTVSLPADVAEGLPTAEAKGAAQPARGPRGRVLVLDDEPGIREAVRRVLAKEHDVSVSGSVAEALERLRAGEHFDMVLCDVMMPGRSGPDFYRDVRAEFPKLTERIVFLTGGVFEASAREFLTANACLCVEKPFDAVELRRLVAKTVSSAPPPSS